MADPFGSNMTDRQAKNSDNASPGGRNAKVAQRVRQLRTDLDPLLVQQADVGALTDSTGGSAPDGTVGPVGATNSGDESGAINANFRDLLTKINSIRDALRALGLMA